MPNTLELYELILDPARSDDTQVSPFVWKTIIDLK